MGELNQSDVAVRLPSGQRAMEGSRAHLSVAQRSEGVGCSSLYPGHCFFHEGAALLGRGNIV